MELENKVVSYENVICSNEDTNIMLDSAVKTVEILKNEREKLENELKGAGNQLEQLNEKVQHKEREIMVHRDTLKGKEDQINILKSVVNDLTIKMQSYVDRKSVV